MHQKTCSIAPFLFVFVLLVYLQLERIFVLRCCYIYLDDLFSFLHSFLLRNGILVLSLPTPAQKPDISLSKGRKID